MLGCTTRVLKNVFPFTENLEQKFARRDRRNEYQFWGDQKQMQSVIEYLPFFVAMFIGVMLVSGALLPIIP